MELNKNYEYNDYELIYLINENNEDAKELLFQKYSPLIHKEINRVKKIAFENGINLNDLTQEAMLAFTNAINGYDENESAKFITFATLCIRRKLSSYINKHKTNKNRIILNKLETTENNENDYNIINNINDDSKDPLKSIIVSEELKETYKNFNKLSKNEKLVMDFTLEGKNPKEIAKITGFKIKMVYNYLHRARNKLKKCK